MVDQRADSSVMMTSSAESCGEVSVCLVSLGSFLKTASVERGCMDDLDMVRDELKEYMACQETVCRWHV